MLLIQKPKSLDYSKVLNVSSNSRSQSPILIVRASILLAILRFAASPSRTHQRSANTNIPKPEIPRLLNTWGQGHTGRFHDHFGNLNGRVPAAS